MPHNINISIFQLNTHNANQANTELTTHLAEQIYPTIALLQEPSLHKGRIQYPKGCTKFEQHKHCLLYTSDAADE